ncbi:hypothetical protein PYK79_42785 [Streptomyces sp. ID05-04B]|uniref:hypothetical protein n=1 Tax=unclassified Streptomyces TaxID=2593676 RepID=UPI000D1A840E|nr:MULTISPECIES: hypothetical protein [unclassified Streptomyces]AVV41762.1 hypothetical protein C6376_10205 [Streptomyces sp. P3]MDX5568719.1 hypothetical protein [Streptomyces sp. ID05-04B]
MIGLVIRVLPFWVREPLLVAFGVLFSGFLFYAAVRDSEWKMAAIGAAVVVFTAIRVHTINRALQDRRQAKAMDGAKHVQHAEGV